MVSYARIAKDAAAGDQADGKGDVTESHLAWKMEDRAGPDVPLPFLMEPTFIFSTISDRFLASMLRREQISGDLKRPELAASVPRLS